MNININFDSSWKEGLLKKVEDDGPWSSWELYKLAMEAEKHLSIEEFSGLVAPTHLPELTIFPHQLEVAKKVIEQMNGKAILADEVGLGKTIEAGLILKEYMIRGLVNKALILVPASLVSQWSQELNQKFYIPAVPQRKTYVWEQCDVVVASIDTAKRNPHRDIVLKQNYDLIIIDEAHKLKNKKTKNYEFIQCLKKKFCLLLTATPVQNKLEEIFNLVSLLKPGHLGDEESFDNDFRSSSRSPKNDERLRELVNKVMVRNRREDTGIEWTKRIVETINISFTEEEQQLYDAVTSLKNSGTKEEDTVIKNHFSLLTLQREVCSSREAAFLTLKNMTEKLANTPEITAQTQNIFRKIEQVQTNSKAEKALELVQKIDDKVIIFTEYRATQLYLQWFFNQHGISSVPFRGGFKRSKKDWMKQLFKDHAQVLIATEAGGEGINLQFCHNIINYDLPWNPMRIEQRIGRIHRLGQEKDVHIYNFAIKNTVEQHILSLLYDKIRLFERVVGELDDILTKMELTNIEDHISDILMNSQSKGEIKVKMNHLSELIKLNEGESERDAAAGDS